MFYKNVVSDDLREECLKQSNLFLRSSILHVRNRVERHDTQAAFLVNIPWNQCIFKESLDFDNTAYVAATVCSIKNKLINCNNAV